LEGLIELEEERIPISEKLEVINYTTIYKSGKWWTAVALVNSFGRKQISLYLWLNRDGKWKRNQKYTIHSRSEWEKIKEAVEKYLDSLKP